MPSQKDETPSTDQKQETAAEKRKTEKKPPPNRGRTFGATGTEKRG